MCPNDAIQTASREGFVCLPALSLARSSFEGGDKMKVSQTTRKSLSIFDYGTTTKTNETRICAMKFWINNEVKEEMDLISINRE